jgi:hypothetical protein
MDYKEGKKTYTISWAILADISTQSTDSVTFPLRVVLEGVIFQV